MKNQIANKQKQVVARVKNLERYVSKHRGELKSSTTSEFGAITTSGTVYYLTRIAEDDTSSGRTGMRINLQKILVRLNMAMAQDCSVRYVLFRDTMNRGAAPSVTEVLEAATLTSPHHYLNVDVNKRFRIIEDTTHNFTVGGVQTKTLVKSYKQAVTVAFNGVANLISSAGQNSIWTILITDRAAIPGDFDLTSRLYYTDE